MTEQDIYYKGLIGSRLCDINGETSDWDYFIISTKHNFASYFISDSKNDVFYFSPEKMMRDWFHNVYQSPPSPLALHCVMNIFSDPVIETPFSAWLVNNRQQIIDSNKPYFGMILLQRARLVLSNPFEKTPKEIMQATAYIMWYIKYAQHPADFKAIMQFTDEELQYFQNARNMEIPYKDMLNNLQNLYDLSKQYYSFWNQRTDFVTLNRLRNEMANILNVTGVKEMTNT